jgi:hypothetical protein
VYVGRAAPRLVASPYANRHRVGKPCTVVECAGVTHTGQMAVAEYRADLARRPELVADARRDLAGAVLACWCPLESACHADALVAIVDGEAP